MQINTRHSQQPKKKPRTSTKKEQKLIEEGREGKEEQRRKRVQRGRAEHPVCAMLHCTTETRG